MPSYSHIKCGVCGRNWQDHVTHDAAGNVVCVGRRPVDSTLTQAEADAAKANRDIHLARDKGKAEAGPLASSTVDGSPKAEAGPTVDPEPSQPTKSTPQGWPAIENRIITSISTADIR